MNYYFSNIKLITLQTQRDIYNATIHQVTIGEERNVVEARRDLRNTNTYDYHHNINIQYRSTLRCE